MYILQLVDKAKEEDEDEDEDEDDDEKDTSSVLHYGCTMVYKYSKLAGTAA